ncbi:MAG: ankyrin repeat domain-containing protein [Burkholderiaceae bacterium]|jgi:ankyrin repeat protein|nr:ankyrin repeat domain-containing protein [Burkholderiaceae bacterium]
MKKVWLAVALLAASVGAWADAAGDFIRAIKQDNGSGMAALLRQGVDPNIRDKRGVPGLYMALQEESLKAAQAILADPRLNPNLLTPTNESALMMAALKGQLDIARTLIAKGAAINKTGWTPLHYAATGGYTQIMSLLIERGAQLDAPSPNGTTPLMMAARYGSAEAVQMLLSAGADPRHRNELGMDALDFAASGERADMVELLAQAKRRAPAIAPAPDVATQMPSGSLDSIFGQRAPKPQPVTPTPPPPPRQPALRGSW